MSAEKEPTKVVPGHSIVTTQPDAIDDALMFLQETGTELGFADDPVRMRRLIRKIDFLVIPFLIMAYLMNYLDKILLNVCYRNTLSC